MKFRLNLEVTASGGILVNGTFPLCVRGIDKLDGAYRRDWLRKSLRENYGWILPRGANPGHKWSIVVERQLYAVSDFGDEWAVEYFGQELVFENDNDVPEYHVIQVDGDINDSESLVVTLEDICNIV